MEVIYYTVVAASLYFISDWILNRVEASRGERFKNRSIIFFFIILVLSFISFNMMRYIMIGAEMAAK